MTIPFHVGSQDTQGKVNFLVIIIVAGYLINIALEELWDLNTSFG